MVVMFVVSVIMTYQQNTESMAQYNFMHLNPLVLIDLGANAGFLVKYGQVYRLLTAIYLHAGIQHLLINSMSIFGLLMIVERKFKKAVFALAFFIGGIQGNLLSLYANFINENDNAVSVGASTSICAILGLYLSTLYLISLKNGTVEDAKKKIGFMVAYLFIISIMPGIDFYGHFGSLIGGALVGLSFSGLKTDYGEDSLGIKKLKLVALIIYANYTVFLLSIFLV
jgi:membrane associated rhomboid family serine protease